MADSTGNTSQENRKDAVREAAISALREGMEAYTAKERMEQAARERADAERAAAEKMAREAREAAERAGKEAAEKAAAEAQRQEEEQRNAAPAAHGQDERISEEDHMENGISMRLPQYEDDYALREAFKSLRTNIEFAGEDKKVLAITSCVRDEGKSFVSMNLAMTLAESGRKVLFVDGDLRKSVTIGRYRIKGKKEGLSNFLAAQTNLDNVLVHTNLRGLDIILAGHVPPNPSELLGGKRFRNMIRDLRRFYEYIIVDCPPIGEVIDAAVIAKACDGIIMVTASGHDSGRFLADAKEQMEKSGSAVLGVVINKMPRERRGHYGRYYGRYYGGYYGRYYGSYGIESKRNDAGKEDDRKDSSGGKA